MRHGGSTFWVPESFAWLLRNYLTRVVGSGWTSAHRGTSFQACEF
jgi:hypothetical protein